MAEVTPEQARALAAEAFVFGYPLVLVERFGYQRAALRKVIEIDSSHRVMLTHPREVAAFITDAIDELV